METKFTKGNWVIESTKMKGTEIVVQTVVKTNLPIDGLKSPIICDIYGYMTEEGKSNARLIADAGTTANKCGLLPSELLAQRDDLLEALISILEKSEPALEHCYQQYSETIDVVIKAKQAIKKATEI